MVLFKRKITASTLQLCNHVKTARKVSLRSSPGGVIFYSCVKEASIACTELHRLQASSILTQVDYLPASLFSKLHAFPASYGGQKGIRFQTQQILSSFCPTLRNVDYFIGRWEISRSE